MAEPGELRVDYDDVGKTLETMREAASNFEEVNEKAFADNLADMEAMNSDFVDAFARSLKEVRAMIKSQIMSEIELFQCYADEAMENLRTTDEAYNQKKVEETNG